ncbi:methionyl-tRNA formyltransferase [Nitrolancea hollandica]|uniref:methionyl-tRNA formyltransferase n=1 Tax=Nitrolancea hollandica TaxID=1206749 RepID=UPI0002E38270|nr:methionyl-tRNA formyltransferase [Nitrolancea hollandica]
MRVVFMGYNIWGHVTLDALIRAGHDVRLVVTHPERRDRSGVFSNQPVEHLAKAQGIPLLVRKHARDALLADSIRERNPEVIVASNWRTWLPPKIFNIPRYGTLNIHDALLPKYGGFCPINWAILNGESQTGVTVHYVNEQLDLGDIVLQQRVPISLTDTATDVLHRTLPLCGSLAVQALSLIATGDVQRIPQDPRQATMFHKRSERDCRIDWRLPRTRVYNLIRAQSDPYPNAFTFYQGQRVRIKQASLTQDCYAGTPGRLFCRLPSGVIALAGPDATGQGQGILIEVVQVGDGPPLQATDFFRRMGGYLETE